MPINVQHQIFARSLQVSSANQMSKGEAQKLQSCCHEWVSCLSKQQGQEFLITCDLKGNVHSRGCFSLPHGHFLCHHATHPPQQNNGYKEDYGCLKALEQIVNFSWEEITLYVWSSWHLLLRTDELLESKLQKHTPIHLVGKFYMLIKFSK